MSAAEKDTIYIDIDDEITGIIEKVRGAKHKIAALVLPKRATTLQSIVNMKLLKRIADENDKHIVLITSEAGLLPIAGAVGLHVAKTLQSKPAIPSQPKLPDDVEPLVEEDTTPKDGELDPTKSIGELAGLPSEKSSAAGAGQDKEDTINVGSVDEEGEGGATGKGKKDKKLKIPNFNRFRTKLLIIVSGLILLIVLWFVGYFVMPKATITIRTNTTTVNDNISFTVSTAAIALDESKSIVPAETKTVKKTGVQKVPATGQKNTGDKATGTMTVTNCIDDGAAHTVPTGTSFTYNNVTFVTNAALALEPALFSGSTCKSANFGLSKDVAVTASQSGGQYNVTTHSYTSGISGITGQGSNMTGGTDKMVTVISQQDVDNAKQKIVDSKDGAKTDLLKAFTDAKLFGLAETLVLGTPAVTSSPNVGDQVAEVTVTAVTDYTMLGVKEDDLKKLVENDAKKQIDSQKQAISDYGLAQGTFTVTAKKSNDEQTLSLQTVATLGAQIDAEALKKQIAGKKRGDVLQIIQSQPSVQDVNISYSPFWVYKTPKKTGKINIIVEKTQTQQKP